MKALLLVASLFVLSGCETMEFVAVDYHSGHNYGPQIRTAGHISYTLGYYSNSYYNGYRVYGTHGHRYYHAPRGYSHHRYYSQPHTVVHQHVHVSSCYARGGHSYVTPTRPRHTPVRPRHDPVPHRTPPRVTCNDRRDRNHDNRRRNDDRSDHR